MKPLVFLRKTLGKRENKSTPKVSESTGADLDPYFLESPQSPVWKSGFGEETSVLSFDIQPALKNPIITVDHDHTDNWDVLHAHIVPNLQGKHGSLFHAGAHGPPHNPSHGPPVLNLGRAVRDMTPPRPPRPPSLNLPFEPPSPVPRSPTRVKFAPDPEPRTRAPLQKSSGHFDRKTPVPIPYSPSEDMSNVPRSPLRTHLTVSADVGSPTLKIYHRASSSSPHLPLRRPQTEPRGHSADRSSESSQDALSSFPVQSAPRVRRRPQPLVLASSSTAASFPSSPLISSTDSTPVGTPTISSRSSPRTSRFPGRPRCTPPQYSAPSSPLPSIPTSPASLNTPDATLSLQQRTLRTSQSTSQLYGSQFEAPNPVHRATSSAPSVDAFIAGISEPPHVSNPRLVHLEGRTILNHSHEASQTLPSETRVEWGYAV